MFWRRAWLWDLVRRDWVEFFNSQTKTRFVQGLSAHGEPQPYVFESWWRWSTQYNPNGEWVAEESIMNFPPYLA